MKVDRLAALLEAFSDGKVRTADQVAASLNVSSRTIYRYIDTLRRLGHPFEGEAGVGYQLRPRNRTNV